MRGTIKKRGKSWRIVVDTGVNPVSGKRTQHTETRRTKHEAEDRLAELIGQVNTGGYVKPSRLTVADFMRRWLREYAATNVRPRTYEEYAKKVEAHIIPCLGAIALSDLQPSHLTKFYQDRLAKGRLDGKGGLSGRTVVHLHRILSEALSHAVKWNEVIRNVATAVNPPQTDHREMAVLDAEGVSKALAAVEGTVWHTIYHVAIFTGLRRGEMLGLRWRDLDLTLGTLSVVQVMHQLKGQRIIFSDPKTRKGKRSVALAPSTVLALRAYRERVEADRAMLGLAISQEDRVFTKPDGSPITPYAVTQAWRALTKKHSLGSVRLHDLRHTHATLMLKQGVHPKVVQERLGHANISVTLDTYSHVLPGLQEAAALRFEEGLGLAAKAPAKLP